MCMERRRISSESSWNRQKSIDCWATVDGWLRETAGRLTRLPLVFVVFVVRFLFLVVLQNVADR